MPDLLTNIDILPVEKPTDEARALVGELDAELSRHYDEVCRHGLSLEQIFAPGVHFFIAYVDGSAMACGGVAFQDGFVELKRMYVRPPVRGRGVSSALLERLEADARSKGVYEVKLETGDKQAAALRFYERQGYRRCQAFPPYTRLDPVSIATSVFMSKRLADVSAD